MHKVIELFFDNHNYEEVEVNINEMKVYMKDNIICSVIDMKDEEAITAEQFRSVMNQLYEGVLARKDINKSVIFGCGKDVKHMIELYSDSQNRERDYEIEEAMVIIDAINHNIMQDSSAFEECFTICKQISEYINSFNYETEIVKNEETLNTVDSIGELLKKSCAHIAIINIVVFLILIFLDSKVFENIMLGFSVNWKKVIEYGQWYRIVTSMFLHWDFNHLFNNMLTLCAVGTFLEKIVGRKWIIISYFVTGILAGFVSLGYNMILEKDVYAAGASGAIFGLIGFLFVVLVMSKGKGEKISGRRLLIYIILVVWAQLSESQVDNAAHIGGIIAGIVMGIVYKLRSKAICAKGGE